MPTNNTIEKIIKGMKEPTSVSKVPFSSDNYVTTSLNIRHLESQPEYNVTILVVDRKTSLVIQKSR
jgi:hypothetical protein